MGKLCSVARVGLWLGLVVGSEALATPILPGFDHLKAGPGTVWDFASNAIPPDFFGPGSDPFEGQVAVVTPTKGWRPVGSGFPGGVAVIPTEIVAMGLRSVEPIRVTYGGGGGGGMPDSFFDVFLTIDPSRGPSLGELILLHNLAGLPDGGSVVESFFDVMFDMQFRPVPDDGRLPLHLYRQQHLVLAEPVPWSHEAPPLFSRDDSGGFYPGFDPLLGPPEDGDMPAPITYRGTEFTWVVRLQAIPEPGTLALLGLGLAALARRRREH